MERWHQRACLSRIVGHTDTKNGTLVQDNIQTIHTRGASMLHYWNVKGYETKIQLHQYCRKCPSGHHKQDDQCNRPIGQQFKLKNETFTMEDSKAEKEQCHKWLTLAHNNRGTLLSGDFCFHIIRDFCLFGFYHIIKNMYRNGGGGECVGTGMPR